MLRIHPQARYEFFQATLYYRNRSPQTATRFIDEVERSLRLISEFPLRYQVYQKRYRKKVITRYPYGIFYRVSSNEVFVLAIYHSSRKPNRWMKRDKE